MTVSLAADMVKGKRSILGKLAKHLTCRHFVIIAFTVGLLLVTSLPAATKIPTLEVDDVVKVLVDRAESVKSYRAKLHLIIQDPEFLKSFFWDPDSSSYMPHPSCFGVLCSSDSEIGGASIYLNYGALEYQCFSVSNGSASYSGLRRIRDIDKKINRYKTLPYRELLPPPESTDTAKESDVNSIQGQQPLPSRFKELDPRSYGSVPNHPLTFIAPYILQKKQSYQLYQNFINQSGHYGAELCSFRVQRD